MKRLVFYVVVAGVTVAAYMSYTHTSKSLPPPESNPQVDVKERFSESREERNESSTVEHMDIVKDQPVSRVQEQKMVIAANGNETVLGTDHDILIIQNGSAAWPTLSLVRDEMTFFTVLSVDMHSSGINTFSPLTSIVRPDPSCR